MTNHPRSQRAKFSKGQVVAVRNSRHLAGPKFFRVSTHSHGFGMNFYGDGTNPQYRQELLRPLTKKEAGR
jgi:hypothetical protein